MRRTILLAKHTIHWQTHPIIETLRNYKHTTIPPLPNQEDLQQEWLITLATIAKTTNKQARIITTNHTRECVQKTISKYRQIYEKNPKRIHKKIFNNQDSPPLDCIKDIFNNILTNPSDISNEIFIQQSISNSPTVPTCHHQPEHMPKCTCGVRQYPWHDLNGLALEKRGTPQTP